LFLISGILIKKSRFNREKDLNHKFCAGFLASLVRYALMNPGHDQKMLDKKSVPQGQVSPHVREG